MRKLTRHAERFKGMTVGLDVHSRVIEYVILDRQGDEECCGRVDATKAGLKRLFTRVGRRKAQYSLEACSCFLWVRDALVARVGQECVHVAQPHRVRPIANSLEKNDANDAWWLAYLCFEGRLPEAYVAEGEVRELRIATRELRSAVHRRSDLIRRFRSHLVQEGRRLTARDIHTVAGRAMARSRIEEFSGMRRAALERLLTSIEEGDAEVASWRSEVASLCTDIVPVQMMSDGIPGLGPITSAVVYAELGDPRRFRSAKAYGKATGLAPGLRESAGHRAPMGMSRAGSSASRWAFTRAVISCMRCRRGAGVQVRNWVLRRSRSQAKKKVIVAAARKIAEGVWRLFALGECFDLSRAFPGKRAA